MRLSLIAVIVAWTASISVSAIPAVFRTTCKAINQTCDDDPDCCSNSCMYTTDCTNKYCAVDQEQGEGPEGPESPGKKRQLEASCS
ncbi:hypothetical protein BDR06DRAFT_953465 [Suillus hirtellus]|nr:hypothetical protein BDR06DRAFT_953465 [Suillus hirtellus]